MSAGVPLRNLSAMAPTAPNSPAMSNPVCALNAGARLPTRPCAAPPLRMFRLLHEVCFHCGDEAVARDRQMAHPHAERIEHGVGDRRRDRAMRGFAGADRIHLRPLDQFDLYLRHLAEAKDRVFGPTGAGDALPVEADAFLQDPARGLDRAAFDLVDDAIGIDGFADIDREGQLPDADVLGALDLGDHSAIGAGVLVAGKADAVADARLASPVSSSRALRRRGSRPWPARPSSDAAGTRPDLRRVRWRFRRGRIRSQTRFLARRASAARRCGSASSSGDGFRSARMENHRAVSSCDRRRRHWPAAGWSRSSAETESASSNPASSAGCAARPGRAAWPLLQIE